MGWPIPITSAIGCTEPIQFAACVPSIHVHKEWHSPRTSDDLHWMTCTAVSIRVQPEREREREERERERKTERQRDRETYLLRCDEEGTVVSFINLRLSQNRNGPITEPGTLPLVSMPVQLLKRASNR